MGSDCGNNSLCAYDGFYKTDKLSLCQFNRNLCHRHIVKSFRRSCGYFAPMVDCYRKVQSGNICASLVLLTKCARLGKVFARS